MEANSPTEVSRILNEAADYLEVNGWLAHDWGQDGGPRCIMGAIASVEGIHSTSTASMGQGTLARYLGDFPQYWNDQKCDNGYEAIDCLKHAAKAVANGEVDPCPLHVFAEDKAILDGAA